MGAVSQIAKLPTSAPSSTLCWYAAYTHARHEKKVAQQLGERGIEHFLPVYRSVRRWKDRRKELELVLFPGYVFVHLAAPERLRVLKLPGVARFVSFNGQPAAMPGADIEALRNALIQGVRAEHHPYLNIGQRVRVADGPLAGAQGILLRTKTNCRVVISIDAIMRSVSVEIDEEDVVPLF
jgi:transcription termination/antitermination protein NusG